MHALTDDGRAVAQTVGAAWRTADVCRGIAGAASWHGIGILNLLRACRGPAARGRGMGLSRGDVRAAPLQQDRAPGQGWATASPSAGSGGWAELELPGTPVKDGFGGCVVPLFLFTSSTWLRGCSRDKLWRKVCC